jgi:hypothetical protein
MLKIIKWLAIGFVALFVVAIILGLLFGGAEDEQASGAAAIAPTQTQAASPGEPTPSPTIPPAPSPTTAPEPTPTPVPITFSGLGDTLTSEFSLSQGVVLLNLTHSGSANFIVSVISAAGDRSLLVNKIGRYSGANALGVSGASIFGLSPGTHRLEIKADGSWTAEVKQPRWGGGQPPPVDWSGSGDNVVAPLLFRSGIVAAKFTHSGSANFIVQLLPADGSNSTLLVNEIGSYSGSQAITVGGGLFNPSPGIHAIVIQADGNWTLSLN